MLFIIVLSTVTMVIQAGVQVPDNCVIDFSDFKANVQGKDWITLYSIDDYRLSPGVSLKKHNRYTILPNDTLAGEITKWSEPERSCKYSSFSSPRSTFGVNKEKAEFQGNGETVVRYVSSYPDKYIITNVCIDGPTCTKSVNSVKVIDQRSDATCLSAGSSDIVLDNIPWDEINEDLKNCYGREFKDNLTPPLAWLWTGRTECPPPVAS